MIKRVNGKVAHFWYHNNSFYDANVNAMIDLSFTYQKF